MIQYLLRLGRYFAAFRAWTSLRTQKCLIASVVFGMIQSAVAQYYYTDNGNGTCTITGYDGPGGAVTIPSTYNGLTVVGIGSQTFWSVSLTSVTIPDTVTNIAADPCHDCTALTSINVASDNPDYCSVNGVLFDKNQTLLIQHPIALAGATYAIPNTVASISAYAFSECSSLASVAVPNGLINIGDFAFDSCSSLPRVTIPNGVTNIGAYAFSDCTSLTNVIIPDSVASMGTYAFNFCDSLKNVTFGRGVTDFGEYAFCYCSALISATFLGNAPAADSTVFVYDSNVTVYYAPGTMGWNSFASSTGIVVAPEFGAVVYGGLPVIFYPAAGTNNTLQWSTNPGSGSWITVSNGVTLTALQFTNPPPNAFFRLQSSGAGPLNLGLVIYGNLPVLFYPPNAAYSPQVTTSLSPPNWIAPSGGNAFIAMQVTNAPSHAVFRLH